MKSLGWGVLRWVTEHLPSPGNPSDPLVLTDEQAEIVLAWYELDDAGRFVNRRGAWQGAKGLGKSPVGAALAIAEFAGPVRFDRWGRDGEPVGRPWGTQGDPQAWIQIAGQSEEQAYANSYALVFQLLSENDDQAARALGIDVGRTRLHLKGSPGAKLEAVSASWGAREGQRVTFAVMEETAGWLKSNGGHKLARVLQRNAAKVDGRTIELTNAHELAEDSVAEQTATAYENGAQGVMFVARRPSFEPTPEMDDETLRGLLAEAYAGAPWVELDRLMLEVRDPGVPWTEVERYYFNSPSAGLSAAVDPTVWAERVDRAD